MLVIAMNEFANFETSRVKSSQRINEILKGNFYVTLIAVEFLSW